MSSSRNGGGIGGTSSVGGNRKKKAANKLNNQTEEKFSRSYLVLVGFLTLAAGLLNAHHVSSLFENDRHFSHLSNLEREMTFRTEMGLYYSYFKTILEADSLMEGTMQLYQNNITEYPSVINTLKRFNLYPELFAGGLYRSLDQLGLLSQQCWTVKRGSGLADVRSCEGLQDPPNFYISLVWVAAGATTSLIFLLGFFLSGSVAGGIISCACFFYNHGESTRVMWTPPLRESFAFPVCLAQILAVSLTTRNKRPGWRNVFSISTTTTLFIIFWQFAQFMLFSQVCAIFGIYLLGCLPQDTLHSILVAQVIGLLNSVALMFGNEMLFTSWFFSSLGAAFLVTLPLNNMFQRLPNILREIISVLVFIGLTVIFKLSIAKAFNVSDDAHIFEILKSKFTDFSTFDTQLYTCAVEFDFLGWEMPLKTSQTLLLPSAVVGCVLLVLQYGCWLWRRRTEESPAQVPCDPAPLYNLLQTLAYAVMAVLIMRLKLFLTPHLCLMAGLLASSKFVPWFRSREIQLTVLAVLVALMSVKGLENIRDQRQIMGEYQNIALEELIDWINQNLPQTAVMAGPMPTMANILLSTRRPIVNHPHYEDTGIRDRTKKVYTVFSRKSKEEVHKTLVSLKVEYLILHSGWCLSIERGGCALTEVWDQVEPQLKEEGREPLCPSLWHKTTLPFRKIFQNQEYAVLQLNTKTLELVSPKTRGI